MRNRNKKRREREARQGAHLPFARDVHNNVGSSVASDESRNLVHTIAADLHVVDGDNDICIRVKRSNCSPESCAHHQQPMRRCQPLLREEKLHECQTEYVILSTPAQTQRLTFFDCKSARVS